MNKIPHPCYDPITKTDCPNRKAGCFADCEKWAEYVTKRAAEYERREHLSKVGDLFYDRGARLWKRAYEKRKGRTKW